MTSPVLSNTGLINKQSDSARTPQALAQHHGKGAKPAAATAAETAGSEQLTLSVGSLQMNRPRMEGAAISIQSNVQAQDTLTALRVMMLAQPEAAGRAHTGNTTAVQAYLLRNG
jgi:hypothetical protein